MDKYYEDDFSAFDDPEMGPENSLEINSIVKNCAIKPDTPIYSLRLSYSNETFIAAFNGEILSVGCMVVVPTHYGTDLAQIMGRIKKRLSCSHAAVIERIAVPEDLAKDEANKEKERSAFEAAKEKIELHHLDMKLVSVHYLLEGEPILFFFTAEGRVDFRELVKALGKFFKVRIELRQIGKRDEARILGGLGICGRGYCCYTISDKLKPVSIKMAKEQNMSLNSMKISGPCGRLLCCLAYEYGFYCEQRKLTPQEGMKILYNGEIWRVIEINLVSSNIKIGTQDDTGRQIEIPLALCEKNDGHWRVKS